MYAFCWPDTDDVLDYQQCLVNTSSYKILLDPLVGFLMWIKQAWPLRLFEIQAKFLVRNEMNILK
jgi:hypothetical protein